MPAVRVDRIWQVVGGCARSKRNPKRPTLSAPTYSRLQSPVKMAVAWIFVELGNS